MKNFNINDFYFSITTKKIFGYFKICRLNLIDTIYGKNIQKLVGMDTSRNFAGSEKLEKISIVTLYSLHSVFSILNKKVQVKADCWVKKLKLKRM